MLKIVGQGAQLCDGISRREVLRVGGLSALGLSLPQLLRAENSSATATAITVGGHGSAKSCIVLFLMGGPPQQSTWDPKPDAPADIRGEFAPVSTSVPGIQFSELLSRTSKHADKICVLRAMSSNDNAHSSSGYYMITGQPHQPMNFENANPGAPNDFPSMGGIIRRLEPRQQGLPASMTLPHRIFNTDGSVWPGQDAGFLGRAADPWLLTCKPADRPFRLDGLTLPDDVPALRLQRRRSLWEQFNDRRRDFESSAARDPFDKQKQQAFDLLMASKGGEAFRIEDEPAAVQERYGKSQFGQSVLMARRLVEGGVRLVQVNWFRGPDEPPDTPCWDSHTREAERLRTVLGPPTDQAYSALLEDLFDRGMLDETLVVCMAEFGRSPKINAAAGRDHWGYVYSVALAGGGVRGGQVIGASDAVGGYPKEGRVQPHDLTATIFDALGHHPETLVHDSLGRPLPISRGEVVRQVF
ncbi:MAG: DUF1501 domain-containing protein [Planctomycetaceae bacterium]